jgi:hypothetical protein
MTLAATVLRKLAEWQPPAPGRQTLVIPDEGAGWVVTVTADRRDEVGCLVWEVALQAGSPAGGPDALPAWARRAAERVTCLLEPLEVYEVDGRRGEALLRSETPAERGDGASYYEVLLTGTGRVTVRRFQSSRQPGQRRQQVAFPMTHEALARLTTDLTAD